MKSNAQYKQTEIGEIPEDWKVDALKNHVNIKGRIGWKGLKKSEYLNNGYAIINGLQIKDGAVDWNTVGRISKDRFEESPEIMLNKNDILMTKDGTIGKLAYLRTLPEDSTVASGVFVIRNNSELLNQTFLFQYFHTPNFKSLVRSRIEGAVIPHLYQRDINELLVPLPPLKEQEKIASILSSLDDKIELNRRMNKTLEEIGKALFKRWFVDFEFPNENGEPYKSSGGEMVESELGEIPKGWETSNIGNHMEIFDSQRIPLSSREREKRKGTFRYIGATGVLDYVNDYLFEGIYLLIGEDGTVTIEGGYPFTQYVWGKFWVNNHAHIIQGKKPLSTEFLKLFFDSTVISSYVTGAVQPKLNQANLKSIPFILPEKKFLDSFQEVILPIFTQIRINSDVISHLSNLRDSLLPRLMSGKIRV